MIKITLGNNIKIVLTEETKQVLKALKNMYQKSKIFDYMSTYNRIKLQTRIEE